VHVEAGATLQDAAAAMAIHDVSSVLIDEGTALLSERDLARAYAVGLGPDSPVDDVATPAPLTASADTTVLAAARSMLQHHVRHLVVVRDDGELWGVVSLRALARILLRSMDAASWACLLDTVDQL
jgi:CBS domain-containing protein